MKHLGRILLVIAVLAVAGIQIADFALAPRTLATVVKSRLAVNEFKSELVKQNLKPAEQLVGCERKKIYRVRSFYITCTTGKGYDYRDGKERRFWLAMISVFDQREFAEWHVGDGLVFGRFTPVYGSYEGPTTIGMADVSINTPPIAVADVNIPAAFKD